jgi:hypothetical protein
VLDGNAEDYSKDFFKNYFRDAPEGVPVWITEALAHCKISLD